MFTLTKDIELSEQDLKELLITIPTRTLIEELSLRISLIQNSASFEEDSKALTELAERTVINGLCKQMDTVFIILQTFPLRTIFQELLKTYDISHILKTLSKALTKQELQS